jgi:hypothetical protein
MNIMNTQNINVKTTNATVLDLGCSTLTLIELVGIESQLMRQKSLMAIGAIEAANIDLEAIGDIVMEIDTMINEGAILTKNAYDVVCSINNLTIMLASVVNKGWMPYSIPSFDELEEAAAVLQAEAAKTAAEEQKPFRVFATGVTEYPEDDQRYDNYYRDETNRLCCVDSIPEAIEAINTAIAKDDWNIREEGHDYYDVDLGHDCGPVSFSASTVTIEDREGKKVIAGVIYSDGVFWLEPATDKQIEIIRSEQKKLQDQAIQERGCDCTDYAKSLERKSERLETSITHEKYRDNAEVLAIIEVQRREEFEQDLEAQAAAREEEFQ